MAKEEKESKELCIGGVFGLFFFCCICEMHSDCDICLYLDLNPSVCVLAVLTFHFE